MASTPASPPPMTVTGFTWTARIAEGRRFRCARQRELMPAGSRRGYFLTTILASPTWRASTAPPVLVRSRRIDALFAPTGRFVISIQSMDGGSEGFTPDIQGMLYAYYEARGWDQASGRPTRPKLDSLGLGGVADDLWVD